MTRHTLRIPVAFIALICFSVFSYSQRTVPGSDKINSADLEAHISFLASPSMNGRANGTKDMDIALNYLASPGSGGPTRGMLRRRSNRAGGIEGGMTNGEPLILRAAMKPIPTTLAPQQSVDLATGTTAATQYQRSDVCAVPAAAVVGEAMVAWILADAVVEKYGGDHLKTMLQRVEEDRK